MAEEQHLSNDKIALWVGIIVSAATQALLALYTQFANTWYRDVSLDLLVGILFFSIFYLTGVGGVIQTRWHTWRWENVVGEKWEWVQDLENLAVAYRGFLSASNYEPSILPMFPAMSQLAEQVSYKGVSGPKDHLEQWKASRNVWEGTALAIINACHGEPRKTPSFEVLVGILQHEVENAERLADEIQRAYMAQVAPHADPHAQNVVITQWNPVAERWDVHREKLNRLTVKMGDEASRRQRLDHWRQVGPLTKLPMITPASPLTASSAPAAPEPGKGVR